jgi:hypothetical protein
MERLLKEFVNALWHKLLIFLIHRKYAYCPSKTLLPNLIYSRGLGLSMQVRSGYR